MKTCSICNTKIARTHYPSDHVEHRDLVMCIYCAIARGWVRCVICDTMIHPDNQNQHQTDTLLVYCNICFSTGFISCDGCDTQDLRVNMYEEDDDGKEILCSTCYYNPTFLHKSLHVCDSYVRTQSKRHYGIELETSECTNFRALKQANCWGAKYDDSITGKEFDSPKMRGDCGFEAIADICDFAKTHKWKVNNRCGYHLHVDVSKESARSLRAIAYAYERSLPVWKTLVKANRINNHWCRHQTSYTNHYSGFTNKTIWRNYACGLARRYEWVNWVAYYDHGTIEIRSHEASLDKTVICNWIRAHLAFVDWAVKTGCKGVKKLLVGDRYVLFDQVAEIWQQAGCDDLIDYYVEKSTLDLELV